MNFIKSHGLGNDYLVAHRHHTPLQPAQVVAICHRHTGIGGDGILEPCASPDGAHGLRIWNPDGSLAEKSGNGLRIYARYLVDHCEASTDLTIRIPAGVVRCQVTDADVTVEMGQATFAPHHIPVTTPLHQTMTTIAGASLPLTAVGVGNPHCVVFFPDDTDLSALPWRTWGAALESHPLFPNRTNVQFARKKSAHELEIRIWERGAGETAASGSSACAVAAAAVRLGVLNRGSLRVFMPGGSLSVKVAADFNLTLCGPVEEVGMVTLSDAWCTRHLG